MFRRGVVSAGLINHRLSWILAESVYESQVFTSGLSLVRTSLIKFVCLQNGVSLLFLCKRNAGMLVEAVNEGGNDLGNADWPFNIAPKGEGNG